MDGGGCRSCVLLDDGGIGSHGSRGGESRAGIGGEGPLLLMESCVLFDVEFGEDILIELAVGPMNWCTQRTFGGEGRGSI